MSEMPKQVIIKGDISGQVAIGNYINQFRDLNGCNITINPPDERPSWERRAKPTKIKPRPPRIFLDRASEIKLIEKNIQDNQPITLNGVNGVGKSTILKQLAHLVRTDQFPDGIYCCSAYNLKLDDLLQCIFSAFYESRIAAKPDRAQIQTSLQEVQALILIDDLMLSKDEIQALLDFAPKCAFVVASTMEMLRSETETIRLGGLPDNESVTLFEQELGRSLVGNERQLVSEICHLLKGHPENIRWVAAKIREEGTALESIIAKLKENSPETLFLETVQSLPKIEQQVLSILAVVDGRTLPQEHITALLPTEDAKQAFQKLTARNLVESHSPAYSLSENFSGVLARSWGLAHWEEVVIKYFVKWVSQKPADQLIENIQDSLVVLMKKAGKRKDWPWVINLGRALEQIFILRGRWQAWSEILHLILEAARASGNRKIEGWVFHQMGSRSLCLGAKEQAIKLLKQSASIRRAIGDQAGLKLTQHNLSIISGAPPIGSSGKSLISPKSILYTIASVGATAITGLGILAGMLFYRPAPPILLYPQNDEKLENITSPNLEWDTVFWGETYRIQVDDQKDFTAPDYDFVTTSELETPTILLKQGEYYWRVCAISRFNRIGKWSEPWKITISISPGKTTLVQPIDGYLETDSESLIFSWGEVVNTAYYDLQIDDNNSFTSPEYETNTSGISIAPSVNLKQNDYYWRVQTYNKYDTPGEWSPVWKFTISTPPQGPSLQSPSNEYVEASTTQPNFEWGETENGQTYQVQVDDNQDFSSPEFDDTATSTNRISTSLAQGVYFWRVRAYNMYDTAGDWSKIWKFTISIPPDSPVLIRPTDGFMEETTTTPDFEWESVSNTTSYQIQVDGSQGFTSPDYEYKGAGTSNKPVKALEQGEFYWHVRAFNVYDTPGNWSETRKLIISIPPSPVKLTSPSNGSKLESTQRPTFSWQSISNGENYQIQIDNSNTFSSPEYETKSSSTSRTPSSDLPQGAYYWRVRALNKYETAGEWSSTWQFTISIPPTKPTLLEPSNNGYVFTSKPTFNWQAVTNATKYQIQVDNNSSFSSPEYYSATSSTSQTSNTTLSQGNFYWRVRALNIYETLGDWSSVWRFTVSIPPIPPTLLQPSNGSYISTGSTTFQWASAANATKYQIQVDNSSAFSSPEYDNNTSGTSVTNSIPLSQGRYYWRVRAFNTYNHSGNWSQVWQFTISFPPGTPNPAEPGYGTYVYTSNPTFQWQSATNAANYELQVDNSSSFSSLEYYSTTSYTSRTSSVTLSQGSYYWRVRALNPYGTPGNWSSVWQFTISIPPNPPNLLEPSYNSYVSTSSPAFRWQSVTNATKYQIQVDNSSSFSSPEFDNISSSTSITSSASLSQEVYYWRVRAFNTYNHSGNWSTVWKFTVSLPPGSVSLLTPYNGASINYSTSTNPVRFSWSYASGATNYQIQISAYQNFASPVLDTTTGSSTERYVYTSAFIPSTPSCTQSEYLFYWRVRAINPYGTYGPWSDTWFFRFIYNYIC